jgi:predicted dehydrogenase
MPPSLCRWGILGTANIARKNWKAIHNAGNAALSAVASRDRDRARRFIDDCQAAAPLTPPPVACGSYEELLGRDDVDAVYLPLPTAVRRDWAVRAAGAGKHVLCEKPCGVRADDVRAILDACARARVQFMDGVMFLHSRRLTLLRQVLDDGVSVGAVRRIVSQFSFRAGDDFLTRNIRASSELEPLGCLGDLGWYNLRFALWVLDGRLPERVSGRTLAEHVGGRAPVPLEFSGELFFAGDVSASFFCSFLAENQQWVQVSGDRGGLRVPDFVLPFFGSEAAFEVSQPVFRVSGCDFNMEDHRRRFAVHEYSNGTPDSQEANMFREFGRLVTSGQLEPRWGELALKTQRVLDACLDSARAGGTLVAV